MSDTNIENTSFLSNLKNKILYKAQKAVYDPDANNYVATKQTIQQSNSTDNSNQSDASTDNTNPDGQTTDQNGQPIDNTNGSLLSMIVSETIFQIKSIAAKVIIPFISVIIATFVINDMIIYPRPIRLTMFIVVALICTFFPFYLGTFLTYYGFKMMYAWYKRHLSEKTFRDGKEVHHRYMPKIFAALPITTYEPCSKWARFFYYPFRYPKYDTEKEPLREIMGDYLSSLKESFTDFDKYKDNPLFKKLIGRVEEQFVMMHKKEQPNCGTEKPSATSLQAPQQKVNMSQHPVFKQGDSATSATAVATAPAATEVAAEE
jgi:hypothetical protein